MEIFLVWHVRHTRFLDGRPTAHRDEAVLLVWDEEDGDNVKLLGVFSSAERAEGRIERARRQPGFRDEPDCFLIDRYAVDEDCWGSGFVTEPVQ